MSLRVQKIKKHRVFEESFKKQLVKEFESGKFSVMELSTLYSVSSTVIYRWIYRYSRFNKQGHLIVEKSKSSSAKVKDLEKRIKELERLVGQKQIMVEFYETMIDLAKEQYDIDIKKNFNTPPSGSSKKKS